MTELTIGRLHDYPERKEAGKEATLGDQRVEHGQSQILKFNDLRTHRQITYINSKGAEQRRRNRVIQAGESEEGGGPADE
jgi:hypothetical protein